MAPWEPLMSTPAPSSMPITDADRVTVRGRYFVYKNDPSRRFFLKGIAFPEPPSSGAPYNAKGWVAVLRQLREASDEINTIRLYRLAPATDVDYSEFFQAAAQMGFYVLVPLTSPQGAGVLDRKVPAPNCYSPAQYRYGTEILARLRPFPNVLGGVLGNEVMNSVESWTAAPCILAYARDLKRFDPDLTLIYTMQHDGIGAALRPPEAVHLTLKYMTEQAGASIDALGVNIESWCSSAQTFELNPDGSVGTYRDLYDHVRDSNISLFFSELGCSIQLFNRDNGLERGARDWKQVHSILGADMVDRWSGFIAYAYDGPEYFRMTSGGPWDGVHPLAFTQDMVNFLGQLEELQVAAVNDTEDGADTPPPSSALPSGTSPVDGSFVPGVTAIDPTLPTEQIFLKCCNLTLTQVDKVPTYFDGRTAETLAATDPFHTDQLAAGGPVSAGGRLSLVDFILVATVATLVAVVWQYVAKKRENRGRDESHSTPLGITKATINSYKTFETD